MQATRKRRLPVMAQKSPMLATVKARADSVNRIQPIRMISLVFIDQLPMLAGLSRNDLRPHKHGGQPGRNDRDVRHHDQENEHDRNPWQGGLDHIGD